VIEKMPTMCHFHVQGGGPLWLRHVTCAAECGTASAAGRPRPSGCGALRGRNRGASRQHEVGDRDTGPASNVLFKDLRSTITINETFILLEE
jgi:hypothetical protein